MFSQGVQPKHAPAIEISLGAEACDGAPTAAYDISQPGKGELVFTRRFPSSEIARIGIPLEVSVMEDFQTDAGAYSGYLNIVFSQL